MVKRDWESSVAEEYAFTHQHTFTAGESDQLREQWLNEQAAKAKLRNTELICRKTADGYDFGFKDFVQYAQFHLDAYGDPPSKRGHKCSQTFPNGVNPYWVKAAEMYLKASDISYDVSITGDKVTFSFDRFSESAALRMMIEGGEIDRVAHVIHRTESFLGRVNDQDSGPGRHLSL